MIEYNIKYCRNRIHIHTEVITLLYYIFNAYRLIVSNLQNIIFLYLSYLCAFTNVYMLCFNIKVLNN